MLIEYVPFGDLLGYLRKSRGLNDTYYKDPDIKPKTSLTSQQLMKFAWQIADGMAYLSSKRVRNVFSYWTFNFCVFSTLLGKTLMEWLICHRNEYVMYSVIGSLIFAPIINLHDIAGNLSFYKRFPLCHPATLRPGV